jgi:hypothetical protein
MNNRHLFWLVGILTGLGVCVIAFKWLVLGFSFNPGAVTDLWEMEFKVQFQARGGPVKVGMYIPNNVHPYTIVDENFVSRGFGLTTIRKKGNRQAIWSKRESNGTQGLYYRATIQKLTTAKPETSIKVPQIETAEIDEATKAAAEGLLAEIRTHSADTDTLIAQLMQQLSQPEQNTNVALIVGSKPDLARRIDAAIIVLSLIEIPARVVHGIDLIATTRDAQLTTWLQIYKDLRWWYVNPDTGQQVEPETFIPIWRGDEEIINTKGVRKQTLKISIRKSTQSSIQAAMVRGEIVSPQLFSYSLFSLPVQSQEVYRILLTIPLGAFLLVILRNVVGVKTFGTFMPVLIALSFRETQLGWGLVLFSLVIACGLVIRFYLEQLKLLLVPRLGAVLIIVIMLMAAISILSHKLGLERGLSVALFPMVIMTMTIERMSIVWEERGATEAIQQGVGSLLVAAIAFLFMSNPYLEHMVFVFPEMLLIVLAITLLLGRYSGLRLLEIKRFKALAGTKH